MIEKRMRQIASRNLYYRRDEIPKTEALRIFRERDEPLKCQLIEDKGGDRVTVYYIDGSPFIDFCLGPHVPNTNKLRAFKLLSLAGAYWMGDSAQPQMQRIYGTAFFSQEELDAWLKQREEAERIIGVWVESWISFQFRSSTVRGSSSGIPRAGPFVRRWKTICAKNWLPETTDWYSLRI